MEELNEYTEKQESKFDIKTEINKYLIHWKWLVLGVLLGGTLAYLYNRYSIPKYKSEASMMIVKEQENSVMNALPSGGGGSILTMGQENLGNQIETLRSKQLVGTVVSELNHNISYYMEGNLITVEAYRESPLYLDFITPDSIVHLASEKFLVTPETETSFVLSEENSGYSEVHELGETITLDGLKFKVFPRKGFKGTFGESHPIIVKISPLRQVANNYISRLEITKKGGAEDILSLALVGENNRKSEDFLNALMLQFNEEGVENKREVAENTASFIQERLEIISTELDSVEGGMAEFKRKNEIMDVASGAMEFQTISSQAEQEIFKLETQLVLIESVEDMLNRQGDYELLPADVGIEEGGISGLINTYNTLVLERNAYLSNSTEKNPFIQTLTAELDSLKENLQDNIESTTQSIKIRLKELNQRERSAEGVFSTFPGMERGIRSIERQQQIKEQLYLFLLQRREEAAISSAATVSVARIIDPAFTNGSPVGPQPWMILAGGIIIGFLIPVIVIFIKNMLDTKVHHKDDLQPLIKHVPFLGDIPQIEKGQNDVIQRNDRTVLAESFRILRTNLNYLLKGRGKTDNKIIFVTSTIKGEGKTFVAYNLARTLASPNKKVIIIGADIRNPQLHRYAEGLGGFLGLSEFIHDESVTVADIINVKKEDQIPVDVISSGRIPPNPGELFMNNRMQELLNELKINYDYIIVDTAPTMLVTDTLLISQLADTTIYVTRAGITEKGVLSYVRELYEEEKLKGMAVVINDVDYSKFGYAAKYGYTYGYGRGPKNSWQLIKEKIFRRS
ncbi:MAG TPA: polysaccharide biosynthesis tyrosine autokinase [Salinimicrobium sp.]|nr:polysaccharide biosynthesis tyrosine autokinase [Salinimicrobium sp.]